MSQATRVREALAVVHTGGADRASTRPFRPPKRWRSWPCRRNSRHPFSVHG